MRGGKARALYVTLSCRRCARQHDRSRRSSKVPAQESSTSATPVPRASCDSRRAAGRLVQPDVCGAKFLLHGRGRAAPTLPPGLTRRAARVVLVRPCAAHDICEACRCAGNHQIKPAHLGARPAAALWTPAPRGPDAGLPAHPAGPRCRYDARRAARMAGHPSGGLWSAPGTERPLGYSRTCRALLHVRSNSAFLAMCALTS